MGHDSRGESGLPELRYEVGKSDRKEDRRDRDRKEGKEGKETRPVTQEWRIILCSVRISHPSHPSSVVVVGSPAVVLLCLAYPSHP